MKLLSVVISSMLLIEYGNSAFAASSVNSNWISGAEIAQGNTLTNSGYIFDYVWNNGALENQTDGKLILGGAYPTFNRGEMLNNGNISITDAIFQNDGILTNNGNVTQTNSFNSWFTNASTGTLVNQNTLSAKTLYNSGMLINQGTISGDTFYQTQGILKLGGSMNESNVNVKSGAITFDIFGSAVGQYGTLNAKYNLDFGTSNSPYSFSGIFSGLADASIGFDFTGANISEIAGHSFTFLNSRDIQGFNDSMLNTSVFTSAGLSFNIQKTFGTYNQLTSVSLAFNNLPNPVIPVPEAEEWTMMLLGLGVMGFVARRKKLAA